MSKAEMEGADAPAVEPPKAGWPLVVFRMPQKDVNVVKEYAYARRLSVSDVIRCALVDSGVLRIRKEA